MMFHQGNLCWSWSWLGPRASLSVMITVIDHLIQDQHFHLVLHWIKEYIREGRGVRYTIVCQGQAEMVRYVLSSLMTMHLRVVELPNSTYLCLDTRRDIAGWSVTWVWWRRIRKPAKWGQGGFLRAQEEPDNINDYGNPPNIDNVGNELARNRLTKWLILVLKRDLFLFRNPKL